MRILISNDDGIDAPGLAALAEALAPLADVWVVAPDRERSAQSHALTLHKPLRMTEVGPQRFAVSGTPADCVYIAVHELFDTLPDLVFSGINRGSNLGTDVFYSGTVAAAREGRLAGIPSVAISLHPRVCDLGAPRDWHWETAASVAARVAPQILRHGLPEDVFLNINVPSLPLSELKGVRASRLGRRTYAAEVARCVDPRGKPYYWVGGDHEEFAPIEGSDGPLTEQGWATVSPLHSDLTAQGFLETVRDWFDR